MEDKKGCSRIIEYVVAFFTVVGALIAIYQFLTGNTHLVISFGPASSAVIATPSVSTTPTPMINVATTVTPSEGNTHLPLAFHISLLPWLIVGFSTGFIAYLVVLPTPAYLMHQLRPYGFCIDAFIGCVGASIGGFITNLLLSPSFLINMIFSFLCALIAVIMWRSFLFNVRNHS